MVYWRMLLFASAVLLLFGTVAGSRDPKPERIVEYQANVPKNIVALQQYRTVSEIPIQNADGQRGTATLTNLNPYINAWYLLSIRWETTKDEEIHHLENTTTKTLQLTLDPAFASGLLLNSEGRRTRCELWGNRATGPLAAARASRETYAPLCEERVFLRNPTIGHKTSLEMATDLLRRNIPGGEKITAFVKEQIYEDRYLSNAELVKAKSPEEREHERPRGAPASPLLDKHFEGKLLTPPDLGIAIDNETPPRMLVGRWYDVRRQPGIFISVIQPRVASPAIVEQQKRMVSPLDQVEMSALVYLIAFDMDMFQMDFELGTEHPGVGWSDRVPPNVRDKKLPGPDGFATVSPLVRTGMVQPHHADRIAVTFVGGFKRYHGAFRWGDFATRNFGSHYGFVENGVVLSKLQPDLATVVVWNDGTVDLRTWTEKDNENLSRIRHARQNGPPIIEFDKQAGVSQPGSLVKEWMKGNWSGSAEKKFRTVRAGLGLHEHEGRRFLIYGYFSSATTASIARIFAAYQCKYAMLLDINALEHTYLAVYQVRDGQFRTQHLVKGMEVLDKPVGGGQMLPRFIGYADNRDFFYLRRKAK